MTYITLGMNGEYEKCRVTKSASMESGLGMAKATSFLQPIGIGNPLNNNGTMLGNDISITGLSAALQPNSRIRQSLMMGPLPFPHNFHNNVYLLRHLS